MWLSSGVPSLPLVVRRHGLLVQCVDFFLPVEPADVRQSPFCTSKGGSSINVNLGPIFFGWELLGFPDAVFAPSTHFLSCFEIVGSLHETRGNGTGRAGLFVVSITETGTACAFQTSMRTFSTLRLDCFLVCYFISCASRFG